MAKKQSLENQAQQFLIPVVVFAAIGVMLVLLVRAARTPVTVGANEPTLSNPNLLESDPTASNDSAIVFKRETLPPISNTPVGINGQLRVCGNQLCNQYGNPIQLRGMSTHGIQWFPNCYNDNSLNTLVDDWGADILRVSLYVEESALGYKLDPAGRTAEAQRIIDLAIERGIYVIIDWHHLSEGDPMTNVDHARTYFTEMANRYRDVPNVFYEITNEPNGGVGWPRIKEYAEIMIPLIQGIDPDGIVLVGTPGWSSLGLSADGSGPEEIRDNPLEADNIMYTFHFYAADPSGHKDFHRAGVRRAVEMFPIFVTEWGTQSPAEGDGANDFASAQLWIDLMEEFKLSWTSWNYADDFRSGSSFIVDSCELNDFSDSRLKEAGAWVKERISSPADNFPTN